MPLDFLFPEMPWPYRCIVVNVSARLHESRSSDYLIHFISVLLVENYSQYVNNFSTAMEAVKRCARKEPQFAEYLRMRQSQSPDKLSLFGLMVKPVQRFPQYILQLQDLLKHTPPGHHDR